MLREVRERSIEELSEGISAIHRTPNTTALTRRQVIANTPAVKHRRSSYLIHMIEWLLAA